MVCRSFPRSNNHQAVIRLYRGLTETKKLLDEFDHQGFE